MSAQAIMVICEGVITGRGLGAIGLATVGLIMPLELINDAVGGGLGIGISTVAALDKGQKKMKESVKAFSDGFWFTLAFSIILALIIGINAPTVADILGATSSTKPYVVLFIRVFMIGYPFSFVGQAVIAMLRVDERPGLSTWIITISAVVALAELYWGVFIAKIGILASAIYYCLSLGLFSLSVLYFIFSPKTQYKIQLNLRLDWKVLWQEIKISFPFILITLSSSIYTWVVNLMLSHLGNSLGIAAFSVINGYVFYVLNMITLSLMQGMQPIASYNYSAKLFDRVNQLIKISVRTNIIFVLLLTIIYIIFAQPITEFFVGNNPALIKIASHAGICLVCLTALGSTSNMMSGYYQAIEKVKNATWLGILKFLLLASPLAAILGLIFGDNGVWLGQPLADMVSFIVAIYFMAHELKVNKKGDSNG